MSSIVQELRIEDVDVPFSKAQEEYEGIKGHIGSAIIIFEFRGERKVLLIQRVGGSKPRSWEVPGGKYEEDEDKTIVDTAIRETEEETGWKFTREHVLNIVYRDVFNQAKGAKNDIHYIIVNQKLDIDNMSSKIKLRDDEHCAYGLFTKEQVKGFASRTQAEFKNEDEIRQAIESGQKLMLSSKKEHVLMAFEAKSKGLDVWGAIGFIGFFLTNPSICLGVVCAIGALLGSYLLD